MNEPAALHGEEEVAGGGRGRDKVVEVTFPPELFHVWDFPSCNKSAVPFLRRRTGSLLNPHVNTRSLPQLRRNVPSIIKSCHRVKDSFSLSFMLIFPAAAPSSVRDRRMSRPEKNGWGTYRCIVMPSRIVLLFCPLS